MFSNHYICGRATCLRPRIGRTPSSLRRYALPVYQIETQCIVDGATRTSFSNPCRRYASSDSNSSGATRVDRSNRLLGRTCMITGGSSGIGYAIAERFLEEGAKRVILVGRSHERLSTVVERLRRIETTPTRADDEVATNAPAVEDGQSEGFPDRISLLVGDLSSASEWTRELERAMVGLLPCPAHLLFLFMPGW